MKQLFSVLIALFCLVSVVRAQDVAIKTNLLYGAYTRTPNLGVEVGLGNRLTLDISGGYNWFNLKGKADNNQKAVHWLVQPELRYWLCERFNGHFFGVHLLGSQYNISEHRLPLMFGSDSDKYRYEGWAAGAGLSYGYHLPLAKHWGAEFSAGAGYAYLKYDRYFCPKCGKEEQSGEVKHYLGPTKAAISIIYTF